MMTEIVDDAVAIGAAAWARLRDHDRATWSDWLAVARALAVGRTTALNIAGANRPIGTRYNLAMASWLRENDLADVVAQERYRLFLILRNLDAVEKWRAGLDEGQRRRLNHPNAVWSHWRRAKTDAERSAPTVRRDVVKNGTARHKDGKPIYWPQDAIRRAAVALRECSSSDIFGLARTALEAAIRSENDLIELLSLSTGAVSALPRKAEVVGVSGHVG
jgi:hypothetical protein